jgi:hypothetical protein
MITTEEFKASLQETDTKELEKTLTQMRDIRDSSNSTLTTQKVGLWIAFLINDELASRSIYHPYELKNS